MIECVHVTPIHLLIAADNACKHKLCTVMLSVWRINVTHTLPLPPQVECWSVHHAKDFATNYKPLNLQNCMVGW